MQSHCGLCAALGTVFRRLMCIAPSRRGSHDSYYTNIERHHGSPQPSLDTSDPNAVLIRMEEHDKFYCDSKRLSNSEVQLVAALDYRGWKTGKFLTIHKRRRRRLTTRSLHDTALLDDLHHGQVQCVLDRVWKWPFNAFTLDTATGGRSLPVLCVHLFHWYGLIDHFNLDVVRIWKFFSLVEEGYHSTNPYHNAIHATDVTQAMHCFLQEEKIRRYLTYTEILSALIAAVTHDLDHPGVNQPFLIATSNHLAALYENTSVLENHHWRSAIGCLLESHLAEQVVSVRPELEKQIASLILATDITRQQEFLTKFRNFLDEESLDMKKSEDRHFILQIALKCADISNPCRPWDISKKWSLKVCEEFFRQGDYERQLNLPVTALCDRHTTSVPKIQAGFFRFVVEPLYKEWHRFLDTPLSRDLMKYLKSNQSKWENLIQQEIAEETRTEISEAEEIPDEVGSSIQHVEERRCSLLTVPSRTFEKRRHSVPLSVSGKSTNGQNSSRRESLPDPRKRFSPMFDEDDELSIVSSCSSLRRSSGGSNTDDRPVSSEALLPDVSIASMTSSSEVQKLTSILHGNISTSSSLQGRLTRQQTFPPVQPYIRPRYLSATGELRGSSSSDSSGGERCLDTKPLLAKEKENVDPDVTKIIRRSVPQNLWKRRGSAPVGLPPCDPTSIIPSSRRGSMPNETTIARQQKACQDKMETYEHNLSLDGEGGNSLTEEERKKRRSKKMLRRRSSGGPETFRQKDSTSTKRRGSLPIDALSFTGGRNIKETMRH
ncbi:high affinity cAMP-specific 3',5'-cyclic phosphodiesterase 7A-like isoform X2 [Cimex lectularius]|uniref:Phosphodiesterase n=1 Tax=Cimex lectularius TaxID=79782 RepID=A0A8I6RTC8_CIMLE|nr:high affinity cAMP-specific 3',5'-cyclic phosphodiesterase 7A-like isoform X2 [Cimex lectularius]